MEERMKFFRYISMKVCMIADLRLGTVWVPKLEQFLLSNVPKLDSDRLSPRFVCLCAATKRPVLSSHTNKRNRATKISINLISTKCKFKCVSEKILLGIWAGTFVARFVTHGCEQP